MLNFPLHCKAHPVEIVESQCSLVLQSPHKDVNNMRGAEIY